MDAVVVLESVGVRRGDRWLLSEVSLRIAEGERWVVFGPNGAGKSTLLSILSARMFPTTGNATILGEELGSVDLAELKPRIGWATSALAADIPPSEAVADVVVTGAYAVTGRWRESYAEADMERAHALARRWGLGALAGSAFDHLSEGERKRVLIARALMPDPELLLLDEPGAGLDLGGREDLVERVGELARDPRAPSIVMVTHHVEEIPQGFTHALVLSAGRPVAAGPMDEALTTATVSEAFGLPIDITSQEGRWAARLGRATR